MEQNRFNQNKINLNIVNTFFFILAVFSLMLIAFYNRYPVIFTDVGTYIRSGFTGLVPVDRPIFYGLFIRHISLAHSLWFVVLAQSILTIVIILLTLKKVFDAQFVYATTFIISLFLSLTTSISYVISHIMPDFFLALVFLGISNILFGKRLTILQKSFLSIIVIYGCMVHLSNLLISLALLIVIIVLYLFDKKRKLIQLERNRLLLLISIVGAVWIIMPGINYFYGVGFKMSRTSNIFTMANFIQSGILRSYLDEYCDTINYPICESKDSLPANVSTFLWGQNSPLYKDCENMDTCWLSKDKEYGIIINDILAAPKYRRLALGVALRKSFSQIIHFGIDGREHIIEGHPSFWGIKNRISHDFNYYHASRQAYGRIEFQLLTTIQYVIVSLSLLFILVRLLKSKKVLMDNRVKSFILFTFCLIMANSFVAGTFSIVANRYQNRIIWLIPFIAYVLVIEYFHKKRNIDSL